MTLVRHTVGLLLGLAAGAIASWLLLLVWLSILDIEIGALTVPLVLTLGLAWTARRFRAFAVGVALGALAETAFLLYLFEVWGEGSKSL